MQKMLKLFHSTSLLVCVLAVSVTSCSSLRFPGVYRIDVAQGNLLTEEMTDKLRIGMSPKQVEYVMGSPMIADTFHPNRWDYVYSLETGSGIKIDNRLSLHFENDRLAKINDERYRNPNAVRDDMLKQMGQAPPDANEALTNPEEQPAGLGPEAAQPPQQTQHPTGQQDHPSNRY